MVADQPIPQAGDMGAPKTDDIKLIGNRAKFADLLDLYFRGQCFFPNIPVHLRHPFDERLPVRVGGIGYVHDDFLEPSPAGMDNVDAIAEQPALSEGRRTILSGLKIFAVSAMNRTPQKTMISASVSAETRDR